MKIRTNIRTFEKGLVFVDKEFRGIVGAGIYWQAPGLSKRRIEVVSQRAPFLVHPDLDLIVRSGALKDDAEVLDLQDNERALVWVDGRFDRVLLPGLYVYWKGYRKVRYEVVDIRNALFEHKDSATIVTNVEAAKLLDVFRVGDGTVGIAYLNGAFLKALDPGRYMVWRDAGNFTCNHVDVREGVLDVAGQEIMTADKVSLRLNSVVTYRVVDPVKSAEKVRNVSEALYRDAQLALRAVVGTRELDALLAEKTAVADELEKGVRARAKAFGVEVISLGIKDVILPGDMKTLLNKVIEAKKASEANVIARREETAAMRSQLNTARLMEGNPALMRLRELEALENVAKSSNLNVVLGDKGLADRLTHML